MDIAKTLIRSIARSFYSTKHVLVIDALMIHSVLTNEDLAYLLGIQPKELRILCGSLKQDRMLAVHTRQETREGQQRPINKDYYYVNFHAAIDAIKYRMYHLDKTVKEMYKPSEEKKEYFCTRCKAQYTEVEVLSMRSPTGFDCERCGNALDREELADGSSTGNERQTKLASQMKGFLGMMIKIDDETIPSNDFDTAYSLAVPVQRDQETNPTRATVPTSVSSLPPAAVKGMTQVDAAPLDVTVTTNSERTAAEKAAEAQRKTAIKEQNALPDWHTKSTVTGESTVVIRKDSEPTHNASTMPKDKEEDQQDEDKIDDELTAYYAQMAQERENEAPENAESDEEEEEDFEEIGLGGSAVATPSSTEHAEPNGRPNGILKSRNSESGSSAAVTHTSTPAASGTAADEAEAPLAKKVKFDSKESFSEASVVADDQAKGSDDEDEEEFENAL
ncbi:hypothetical protein ACLMJK_004916 [Lecanora helva]